MVHIRYDLDPQRPHLCSIWFDPMTFQIKSFNDLKMLGLCDNQIDFLQLPRLQDKHHGTRTRLYFPYCSVDCVELIPRSVDALLKTRSNWEFRETAHEDLETGGRRDVNLQEYRKIEPKLVVTRYAMWYPHEVVTVYRTVQGAAWVRYTYDGTQYAGLDRLRLLSAHDNTIHVGNNNVRTMLGIG